MQPKPKNKSLLKVAVVALITLVLSFSMLNTAASLASGLWNSYLAANGGQIFKAKLPDVPELDTVEPKPDKSGLEDSGVVLISAKSPEQSLSGTGIVINKVGLILTNYHVVRGSEKITVNGQQENWEAKFLGCDENRDVALLKIPDNNGLTPATLTDKSLAIGQLVKIIGNAEGQGFFSSSNGTILAFNQTVSISDEHPNSRERVQLNGLIQTSAKAVSGDSGGPLLNEYNQVLGMTTAGSTSEPARSYAIPINEALDIADQIIKGEATSGLRIGAAGYLGVKIDYTQKVQGALVYQVVRKSPAYQVGIRPGDRLISVAGKELDLDSAARTIREIKPGNKVEVVWENTDGQKKTAMVVFDGARIN